MLKANGKSADNIALELLNSLFSKEIKDIPTVSPLKSRVYEHDTASKRRDGRNSNVRNNHQREKVSEISINLGKNQKINPNYILGALVEATGISGKSFGKINIHDNFTVVEVPYGKADHIITAMKNGKIKGNKVTVTKRENSRRNQYGKQNNAKPNGKGKNNRRYRKTG